MSKVILSFHDFFESYKKWVSSNPQFVSDLESTAKWIPYFAGRISNSLIISELIYSLSNILVLFNDKIIEKTNGLAVIDDKSSNILKLLLTTLEYCEVFIEITAKKLWGTKGRWLLIVIVQVIKAIGRYLLINRYSEEIICVPPIPNLNRKNIQKQLDGQLIGNNNSNLNYEPQASTSKSVPPSSEIIGDCSFSFKLKRSGRIVRKIEGAPPMQFRNLTSLNNNEFNLNAILNENEERLLKTAEKIYIAKPLVHLAAVGLFGYKSWKSYATSLLLDLASIRLYYNNRNKLTKKQKLELSRRCVNLLLYFVRSPLYEKSTEKRLKSLIKLLSNIPLIGSICNPLIDYIPHWQGTYFYMWST